jgi:hypothetical protein
MESRSDGRCITITISIVVPFGNLLAAQIALQYVCVMRKSHVDYSSIGAKESSVVSLVTQLPALGTQYRLLVLVPVPDQTGLY